MSEFLSSQVALVTGGAVGIGRAVMLAFVVVGVKVVTADLNGVDDEDTVEATRQVGGEAPFIRCDVTRDVETKALVESCVTAYDRLDYALNNVGIEAEQDELADDNEAEFDAIMAVNVEGVWSCIKHQVPLMLAQDDGTIVNTASVAGLGAAPKTSIYATSKHTVISPIRSAVIEHAKRGIRANAMRPAVVDTNMFRRAYEADPCKAGFAAVMYPLGRIGWVEEIAAAVLYLCGDNTGLTTGIALSVDGGVTAIWAGGGTTGMPRRGAFVFCYRSIRGSAYQITAGGLTWVENPGPKPVSIISEQQQ